MRVPVEFTGRVGGVPTPPSQIAGIILYPG